MDDARSLSRTKSSGRSPVTPFIGPYAPLGDKIFSQCDNNLAPRKIIPYYPNQARCSDRTVPPGVNAALTLSQLIVRRKT